MEDEAQDQQQGQQQGIGQLQMVQQNLQRLTVQKQQSQMQVDEIETALNEIGDSEETYRIIGDVMVQTDKDDLKDHLESEKEEVEARLENIENQEEKLRNKAEKMQQEVMSELKGAE